MIYRTRAPLRISFAGGGTDVSPYADERGGAILSATINRYAYATIAVGGESFSIRSLDYDASLRYGIEDPFVYDGQLDLAKAVIDHFREQHGLLEGFELVLHNDAPPGSGLGSSSAITVAMVKAITDMLRMPAGSYEIAEVAHRIEREDVGIQGGRQDHYAASFGGFNFMEFRNGTTVVTPLRLPEATVCELEYSVVFAYVGGTHFSSHILQRQVENYRSSNAEAVDAMDRLKELAFDMKEAMLLGRLQEMGRILNESWQYKKRLAQGITNPAIDDLYERAVSAGALGGKISGAGGGGFMFFLCDSDRRFAVQQALRDQGAQVVNHTFTQRGVHTWSRA